jgi:small subunit ribosomal protein S15
MARMHSRKKGASRSRPPYGEKLPAWSDMTKEELKKTVTKLHDSGMAPTKIGLTLRDQYGVPSVRMVLGENLDRFMRSSGMASEVPEDLANLMRKALHIRKHVKANDKDVHNKRALQLTESKIRRLVRYYHSSGKLAAGWEYSPEAAEILVT